MLLYFLKCKGKQMVKIRKNERIILLNNKILRFANVNNQDFSKSKKLVGY